jgi:OmpA-OmpF porin, OOP family
MNFTPSFCMIAGAVDTSQISGGGGLIVRSFLTLASASLLLVALATASEAQGQRLGPDASSEDFIRGLIPPTGAPAVKYRGLRVLNTNPSDAAADAGPAVNVDIKFALNSATLSDDAKKTVRQMALAMNSAQLAPYHFLIEGHTDTTGSAAYNLVLSKKRADAVRQFLIDTYQVDGTRLEAVGRGQTKLADPDHPDSSINRRVEIVNLGN